MKYILIVLVLLSVTSFALRPKKLTSVQQQRLTEIKKGNSWASVLLNLAELHMMSRGPLEELVSAIQDVITDLGDKKVKREEQFAERTAEHQATVKQLEGDIANAEAEIERITNLLAQLADEKVSLEKENAANAIAIEEAKAQIEAAATLRKKQHEDYQAKVLEVAAATDAVNECIAILNELQGGVSLLQVKKIKVSLAETQKKIQKTKNVEAAFLNALVEIASRQEFADTGAVKQLVAKFQEIKDNLQISSVKLAAEESNTQAAFENFVVATQVQIADDEQEIKENNARIVEIVQAVADNETILAARKADKASFEEALQQENDAYEVATERFNNYIAENAREVAVCEEALEVVSTVNFEDYIGDRVNAADGLVSSGMATAQQHGTGLDVFQEYDV